MPDDGISSDSDGEVETYIKFNGILKDIEREYKVALKVDRDEYIY